MLPEEMREGTGDQCGIYDDGKHARPGREGTHTHTRQSCSCHSMRVLAQGCSNPGTTLLAPSGLYGSCTDPAWPREQDSPFNHAAAHLYFTTRVPPSQCIAGAVTTSALCRLGLTPSNSCLASPEHCTQEPSLHRDAQNPKAIFKASTSSHEPCKRHAVTGDGAHPAPSALSSAHALTCVECMAGPQKCQHIT